MLAQTDPFTARDTFETGGGKAGIYRLSKLEELGLGKVGRLPYSIRVLLESVLRNCDGYEVTEDDVQKPRRLERRRRRPRSRSRSSRPASCCRISPACRAWSTWPRCGPRCSGWAAIPKKINPLVPVDLVIDHSVQVDYFDSADALELNIDMEFSRNRERYEFLRWGQKAFNNFRVVPPGTGIVHQVNLEYLAKVVFLGNDHAGHGRLPRFARRHRQPHDDDRRPGRRRLGRRRHRGRGRHARPADLHAAARGRRHRAHRRAAAGRDGDRPGAHRHEILRKDGVVGKFVEFFGAGVSTMPLADRATIGNMAPEYGATMGFFPVDDQTLRYLRRTGRTEDEVELVERYTKEQGLFRTDDGADADVHQDAVSSTCARSSRAWPGRSGRRTACRST